jgi:hypothetical protein
MVFKRLRANEFICVWSIWNGLFLALLAVSTVLGYTQVIFKSDRSMISFVIAVVFAVGWVYSLIRALWINRAQKQIGELRKDYAEMVMHQVCPGDAREALAGKLAARLSTLDYIPIVLVSLGLVGTVLGFIIGMGEVKPEMIGNIAQAGQSLTLMMKGLSIGFVTTLVGVSGGIWIQFQKHMLSNEVAKLYERILDGRPEA